MIAVKRKGCRLNSMDCGKKETNSWIQSGIDKGMCQACHLLRVMYLAQSFCCSENSVSYHAPYLPGHWVIAYSSRSGCLIEGKQYFSWLVTTNMV